MQVKLTTAVWENRQPLIYVLSVISMYRGGRYAHIGMLMYSISSSSSRNLSIKSFLM
jgi:hypothetical protein